MQKKSIFQKNVSSIAINFDVFKKIYIFKFISFF